MAVMRNILSIAVASVASPCSCRFVLLLGINWVSLSYRWTTIDSNNCVFLGAGAVNKNQITANSMSDNFVFAELKSTPVGGQ